MGSAWRIGASSQLIHARMTTAWTCLALAHDATAHRLAWARWSRARNSSLQTQFEPGFELHEPANFTLLLRSAS